MLFGAWSVGTINAYQTLETAITFDSPMPDTNYMVTTTVQRGGAGWAAIRHRISSKSTTGFNVVIFNDSNAAVSQFEIGWAVLYHS